MEHTTQRAALTRDQLAMVRAEIRAQRDGLRGRADIMTRIKAARGRYSHNPQPGKAVRVALGVIGIACVITHTWRRRIGGRGRE